MNFVRVLINLFQFNRTNWKAVILCLLAAAIFWLFNAFNKSHSSTIRFPLRFEFDNQRYVAVKPLSQHININVTGSGWELIRKTLGVKLPELLIPLDRPLEIRKIPASTLTPLLASQLGNLQVNYITVDTLHIQLDEKISKTFRLTADLSKIKFKDGFGSTGVAHVFPDSVVIDGPKSIVNNIPDTISLTLKASGISKSFHDEVEIPLFNSESVNRNPPVVSVKVEVGRMEMVEALLHVRALNQSRLTKSLFDEQVKVLVQIPTDQKEALQNRLTQAIAQIDLKDLKKGAHKIYPKIIGLSPNIQVVSIDSVGLKIN